MFRFNVSCLFPLAALSLLVFGLSQSMFKAPPVGKLMDPFIGAVQNGSEPDLHKPEWKLEKTGVRNPVSIYFDDRKVPHIYAANSHDLYFAQGYVTARLRLWQMDFLSYASAGRLAEIFGTGFLDYDRNQRRIGIPEAARRSLELIRKDTLTDGILKAYTEGVNAYIRQLTYRTIPLEYKVLDYEPEPWSELKTVLIMKYMGNTLSGYEEDFSMSNLMLALGETKFNKLFPDSLAFIRKPSYLDYSFLSSRTTIDDNAYNPKLGSNCWAVGGKKTKSGFPILCNDPHLNLSLPAIWLEMQLTGPGMNVYGVSIPGTPAVIIGFNQSIAWGLTNGADDVKDWYKLKITDDYRKYEWDGKWVDLKYSVEEIGRKGQKAFFDTIYRTVHGPIVYDRSFPGKNPERMNFAMRWQLHEPSDEFQTFIKLNAAKDYAGYKEAIRSYSCPAQNFVFACKDGTIAANHQGSLFKKQPGEGKFILDGTRSEYLYRDHIPFDSLPALVDPPCNYLVSANQHPAPAGYPYYYNGYFNEDRATRIRTLLNRPGLLDASSMEVMQLDNAGVFAMEALPLLLKNVNKDSLTPDLRSQLKELQSWNGRYDFMDTHALLFNIWWKFVKDYTWDEFNAFSFYAPRPDGNVLLKMIRDDPGNIYFDRQGTTVRENAGDIILHAFVAAVADYSRIKKAGSIKWGDQNLVNIMHPTNIPAFSYMHLPSAGFSETINAISPGWGPSWRMIVQLGDRPTAFGIYPGGQSGNVGSPYYDNFVRDWNQGRYYPLKFFISREEARKNTRNSWILE